MTDSRPEPRPELRVRVAEMIGRPGAHKEVVAVLVAEQIELEATDVRVTAPIDVALAFDTIVDGLSLTGTLTSRWQSLCRRCLEPVDGDIAVKVDEICSDDAEEGETWPIDKEGPHKDTVDVAAISRELVTLALPLSVLCAEGCVGPDPERFLVTPEADPEESGDLEEAEPAGDPRWAALDDFKFD